MSGRFEQRDLIGLPEVARRVGLHRATINEMVIDGRLPACRLGPHWFVRREDVETLERSYVRPKNSPRRKRDTDSPSQWQHEILTRLSQWGDATACELHAVIKLHIGNIRKHLCLLEAEGLVVRDEYGSWRLTPEGSRLTNSVVGQISGEHRASA